MTSNNQELEELAAHVLDLHRDMKEATNLVNRLVRLLDLTVERIDELDADMDELTERICQLEGDA